VGLNPGQPLSKPGQRRTGTHRLDFITAKYAKHAKTGKTFRHFGFVRVVRVVRG
jgi:hypothetical protein